MRRLFVGPTGTWTIKAGSFGAELLRLACCLATERGLQVIASVHDALAVEAEASSLEAIVAETQQHMAEGSEAVLGRFQLRSDVEIIRYPGRFLDERGVEFCSRIVALLEDLPRHKTGRLSELV